MDRISRATGTSRSELHSPRDREHVPAPATKEEKLEALRRSAGSWADRDFTGAEYVDAIRGDLNERLRRLGLE
jgi:hypothetical protein